MGWMESINDYVKRPHSKLSFTIIIFLIAVVIVVISWSKVTGLVQVEQRRQAWGST